MSAAVTIMMLSRKKSPGHDSGCGSIWNVVFWFSIALMLCLCGSVLYGVYTATHARARFSIVHADGRVEQVKKRAELKVGETLRVEINVTGRENRQVSIRMFTHFEGGYSDKLVRLPTGPIIQDFVFKSSGENNLNVLVHNEAIDVFNDIFAGSFEISLTIT